MVNCRSYHLVYSTLKTTDTNSNQTVDKTDISFCGRLLEVVSSVASWLSLKIFVREPRVVLNLSASFLYGMLSSAWIVFLVPHAIERYTCKQCSHFVYRGRCWESHWTSYQCSFA